MDAAQALSFPRASLHDHFQGQAILGVLVLFLTHRRIHSQSMSISNDRAELPQYISNLQAMLLHIRTERMGPPHICAQRPTWRQNAPRLNLPNDLLY